jgi:protein phosphatase
MRIRSDVELANISDVGCERTGNEDYFLYIEPEDDVEFSRLGRLILVADGMGGCAGGEVASRLAADTIRSVFLDQPGDDPRQALIAGFQAAHHAILDHAGVEPELRGMGTTCCAAILKHGQLHYAHVGDSRIYLIRDGRPEQLTEDHSLVARMVRDGLLSPEEAEHSERRNVLTAALGMDSDKVAGDFPREPLKLIEGDVVLICTDGLHGLVNAEEMAEAAAHQSLAQACQQLVDMAKERGGQDNITVQLLGIRQVET